MACARALAFKLASVNLAVLVALACSSGSEPAEQMASGALDPTSAPPGATEEAPPMSTLEPERPPVVAPVVPEPTVAPSTELVVPVPPPEPGDVVEDVCVAQSAASELRRVYMAFAFDVSASMGSSMGVNVNGMPDTRRFVQKWEPVVAATKSFFAEKEAAGISASLMFFPTGADPNASREEQLQLECGRNTYLTPDVPQTLLPSSVFAEAIDALDKTPGGSWPLSTPTLAAYESTVASLRAVQASAPDANAAYVIVLVTDGLPLNCGNNAAHFANVLAAVGSSGIKTFVVGVELEANAASNLNQLAVAGGTDSAFIIQTGDPVQTERDFKEAIDDIRGVSVSCQVEIPIPPVNTEFIPEQVNVTYKGADDKLVRLTYDPECAAPDSWRYDDPNAPATILLCEAACGTVKADVQAKLEIEFGCKRQDVPR
jgi:hypothetical protein